MRFRKSSAPILATGLALVLVPGPAYATALAPATRHAQAPAQQAKVTVASGTATAANGSAVRDAIIDLYAWPSGKVLQALKPGQEVPRTLVATAIANSAGKFSLSLAPGTLSANAVSSGFVNLEADSGSATWFFSTDAAKPAATAIRLTGAGTESPDYCTPWKEVKNLGAQPAIVGQAYIAGNYKHVTDSFTYTRGQSSSLGVGISPSGKKGTFTASGTVSTSSTANQGFPTEGPGNTLFLTFFKAGVYHDVCGTTGKVKPDGASGEPHQRYVVRSTEWVSGDKIEHPRSAPRANQCTPQEAGSSFQTTNERAVTWSAGFSIPPLGFNGQAQTGYDTSAELSFAFGSTGELCGTNDYPPGAAQVVAKKLSSVNEPQTPSPTCHVRGNHVRGRLPRERLRVIFSPRRAPRPSGEPIGGVHAGQPWPRGHRGPDQCHQQQRRHAHRRCHRPRPAAGHQAGRRVPHAGRRGGRDLGHLPTARRPGLRLPRLVKAHSGGRRPHPARRDDQHHPRDRADDHDGLKHL